MIDRALSVAGLVGRRTTDAADRAGDDELTLLDEPSLGLAPLVIRRIFEAIRTLNECDGISVLIVE